MTLLQDSIDRSVNTEYNFTPESPFLIDLFSSFNERSVGYCVARNYEGLPYDLCGHDLDILIRKKDVRVAIDMVRHISIRHNGNTSLACIENGGLVRLLTIGMSEPAPYWGVRIDLQPSIAWMGFKIDNIEDAISSAVYHGIVRVYSSNKSTITTFILSLFHGNHYSRHDYHLAAAKVYHSSPEDIRRYLKNIFGEYGQMLIEVLKERDFTSIDKVARKLKIKLMLRQLLSSPLTVARNKLSNILVHFSRITRRPGMTIAVLGLDGSGKTALIGAVQDDIRKLLHTGTQQHHLRPGLLPSLSRLFRQEQEQAGPVLNPHAKPSNGIFLSIVRLLYFALDYILGFWICIYPDLLRNPIFVFFDRYYYDFVFDPKRCRMDLPEWIIWLIGNFIPKPDLVIVIKPEPEVFHNRKPELPLEELQLQALRMQNIFMKLKNVLIIDTCSDFESSRQAMLKGILQSFQRRLL